jgi:hypothetical protein
VSVKLGEVQPDPVPLARPVKIPTERRLTVGIQFYEYPPGEDGTPRRSRRVP